MANLTISNDAVSHLPIPCIQAFFTEVGHTISESQGNLLGERIHFPSKLYHENEHNFDRYCLLIKLPWQKEQPGF